MAMIDRSWSLRRRVIAVTAGAALVAWLVGAFALYGLTLRVTGRAYDSAMVEAAELLLVMAEHEYAETGSTYEPLVQAVGVNPQPYMHYQVWTADHRLLLRSAHAPAQALAADFASGLSDQTINDEQWRVYATFDDRRALQIQLGEPAARRLENGGRIAYGVLVIALWWTVLLCGAMWAMLDRVVLQMRASAREIGNRSAEDLSPLSPRVLPSEFQPLADALNALLMRLKTALETEKRITADASHELRTPLAAIKMQAQVARRATSPEAANEALVKLEGGVDRAVHLVDQLLMAARVAPTIEGVRHSTRLVDMRFELQELLDTYRELIERKTLRVSSDIAQSCWNGDPMLARVLLRNLLDNALRYTPAGGEVRIRCQAEGSAHVLEVSDNGPGIPDTERSRVFDPYYRIPGSADTGSGLGLSIASGIVHGLHGSIELASGIDGRGITVRVRLPPS